MSDAKDPSRIELRLRDHDNAVTLFQVKRTTKFGKLKAAYAARKDVRAGEIRLLFDGKPLLDNSSPQDEEEMDDGDAIDVMLERGCRDGGADVRGRRALYRAGGPVTFPRPRPVSPGRHPHFPQPRHPNHDHQLRHRVQRVYRERVRRSDRAQRVRPEPTR
jgi:hypothetical protein